MGVSLEMSDAFDPVGPLGEFLLTQAFHTASLRLQRLREVLEILGPHVDDSAARAINIRYEKERYGKSDGQN